ncbi:MAG TPA: hypothetical protein VFP32_01985 [Candidatus Saccharimonadales bacterium]|nr:hypothetical protein [Candidatus Saccharimonadales bacterium]
MAKRVISRTEEQMLMQLWWVRAIIAIVFIALAYGFASVAINSGSTWQYAVAIGFLWYGLKQAVRSVRLAF